MVIRWLISHLRAFRLNRYAINQECSWGHKFKVWRAAPEFDPPLHQPPPPLPSPPSAYRSTSTPATDEANRFQSLESNSPDFTRFSRVIEFSTTIFLFLSTIYCLWAAQSVQVINFKLVFNLNLETWCFLFRIVWEFWVWFWILVIFLFCPKFSNSRAFMYWILWTSLLCWSISWCSIVLIS